MFELPRNHNPDGIIEDPESLAIKSKLMVRLDKKNWYDSVSNITKFLGTMLLTTGTGMALTSIIGGSAVGMGAIAILAIGAVALTVAVATDHASSRIWQGANYDTQEAVANSTARHIVKEFNANNLSVTSSAPAAEAPPKNWAAQVAPGQQPENWATQVEAQRQQQETAAAQQVKA